MKMNNKMRLRWIAIKKDIESTQFETKLKDLSEDELINKEGAIIFKSLFSIGLSPTQFEDITRFEAVTNKIHVKDYIDNSVDLEYVLIQGFKFVNNLKERLSHLDNHFRIILCLDPDSDEVTIRFFVKRSDVRYGSDDPDDYTLEEVAFWDI